MIKKLLSDAEYTITSTTTIVIDIDIKFEHKNISLITQTLSNDIVFNFACEDLRATLLGNTITLVDDVVILGEELSIILSFEEGSSTAELKDITLWNKRQEGLLEELLEEQKLTNKLLKKIYNPE